LRVFDAVHTAGSVSRAAERLGLSQPATSHALTRLRLTLKDPLFVRAPGGVRPTARAEHFARFVGAALRTLDVALNESAHFDPAQTERRFALHMSDLATGELLPPLLAALRERAPGLRLEVHQLDAEAIAPALEAGRIDLAFGFLPQVTGVHRQDLLDERYVVLLREGHPLRARIKRRANLSALEFVLVQSHSEPAKALLRLGLESRIRLTIPHFAVVPALLKASDLAVIIPERPARSYARGGGLAVVEADLGLPPMKISQHWVWRVHNDPGHRWLREQVSEVLVLPTASKARRK
ncbi:MAG: LysR family transcriptional regulator, partial [Burkholderiales bacterium]|nr:LysR family transcriptional regulator [Burkholderiales bacterium]